MATFLQRSICRIGRPAAGPLKLRQAYARTGVYRLQPARIVLIDNSKGFGHKETLEIPT